MKKVAILGSTGSIGTQTLDVIRTHCSQFEVVSLVAYSNEKLLMEQCAEFNPRYSALISEKGENCLIEAVKECDVAVIATRGIIALDSVLYCIQHNIDIALANKETLVCAGQLVNQQLANSRSRILPVDSEHCAIWQCLDNNNRPDKLILTASGGAFYNLNMSALSTVNAQDALKHPNWNMGAKITVDSATMMNKALEVIEAHWLFDMPICDIDIVVHRQSIVHSMVQYADGSVIAQLANPDMRLPIQYALSYPDKSQAIVPKLSLNGLTLTFEQPDTQRFPCVNLAYDIATLPPLSATVMNAANDICVQAFFDGKLLFTQFYTTIRSVVDVFVSQIKDLDVTASNIKNIDNKVRDYTRTMLYGE